MRPRARWRNGDVSAQGRVQRGGPPAGAARTYGRVSESSASSTAAGRGPRRRRVAVSRSLLDSVGDADVGVNLDFARLVREVTDAPLGVGATEVAAVARRTAKGGEVGGASDVSESNAQCLSECGGSRAGVFDGGLGGGRLELRAVVHGVGDVGVLEKDTAETGGRVGGGLRNGVQGVYVLDCGAESGAAGVEVGIGVEELDVASRDAGVDEGVDDGLEARFGDGTDLRRGSRRRLINSAGRVREWDRFDAYS